MLRTVVADRPEDLLDELVTALRAPLADPSVGSLFTPEWVSVPSLGMATWLREQLSQRLGAQDDRRDGISANIEYPFPGVLRWAILDAHRVATGGAVDVADPWRVDRLVWSLLDVLSDPPADLDDRLSERGDGVTLAGRAGPLADLFDQYVVHRPQMVLDWLDGRDVGADGEPIDPARSWQPQLFRALQRHIAQRHGVETTPAERLVDALALVRDGALELGPGAPRPLPPRLFVAGQSLITAELGPVLSALGAHRDVTLLVLSPSARTSVEVAERTAGEHPELPERAASWAIHRPTDEPLADTDHPLLITWARRPFDSAALLGAGGVVPELVGPELVGPELVGPAATAPATLLERIQGDLQAGTIAEQPFEPDDEDRSVQLHGAPGRTRQVEVLRDTILALLRDDATLTERDVAIVCPQLEEFAPVLTAVLGPSAAPGEQPTDGVLPALRYAVVDRSARSFNPVLDGLAALLELLPGRFAPTSVRNVLALPAVRQRFGLSTEDLELAGEWVTAARVRWGLDDEHRRRWKVLGDDGNSWRAALDQLLMGVALGDDLRDTPLPGSGVSVDPVAELALAPGGVAPLSLADGDLAGAGRVAAALRSFADAHERLVVGGPRPVAAWCEDLQVTLDEVLAAERFEDWQRSRVDELLGELRLASSANGSDGGEPSEVPLELADLRRLLAPSLDGARARADLGFGSIVVARPALLQSVPHRVVCVLGLDGEALPSARDRGDDLLRHAPMAGDRDPRAEARAELLAAIGAARDTFVVTFNSTDVRTNIKVPEAVVLDELVEVLAVTLGTTPTQLRDPRGPFGAITHHPRQAFDPANFVGRAGSEPIGFDPVALKGARALEDMAALQRSGPSRTADGVLIDRPLPDDTDEVVELDDLRSFFTHPVRSFFRRRLDVVVPEREDEPDEELPTSLGSLDRSWIGRQLVATGVQRCGSDGLADGPAGGSPDVLAVMDAARARGLLPPEALAASGLDEICTEAALVLDAATDLGVCRPATDEVPVDFALAGGVRLVGTVSGCVDGGCPGPVRLGYGRPKPHWRVQLAIDLFATTVTDPSTDRRAVLVGRAESKRELAPVALAWRVSGDSPSERRTTALAALEELVAIRADGLRLALPLFDATSFALAEGGRGGDAWGPTTGEHAYKEAADRYHELAFGSLEYAELLELSVDGHTAYGEAERLWGALDRALAPEDVEPPDAEVDR